MNQNPCEHNIKLKLGKNRPEKNYQKSKGCIRCQILSQIEKKTNEKSKGDVECPSCKRRSSIEFDEGFHCEKGQVSFNKQKHQIEKRYENKRVTFL